MTARADGMVVDGIEEKKTSPSSGSAVHSLHRPFPEPSEHPHRQEIGARGRQVPAAHINGASRDLPRPPPPSLLHSTYPASQPAPRSSTFPFRPSVCRVPCAVCVRHCPLRTASLPSLTTTHYPWPSCHLASPPHHSPPRSCHCRPVSPSKLYHSRAQRHDLAV